MVRKIITLSLILSLCCAFCATAQAATYSPYEGTPSNTYITYYKDILSGLSPQADYVAFRADQYKYIMAVGDLEYNNGSFTAVETVTLYVFDTEGSSYNSNYTYTITNDSSFKLNQSNRIIYSNLGQFPQLTERGSEYEIITAVLLLVIVLSECIRRIFRNR